MTESAKPDQKQKLPTIWETLRANFKEMGQLRRRFLDKTKIKKTDKFLTRVFKRSLFIASALTVPTTAKKVLVYIGTYFIVHPLTLMMFPTAATALRQQGMDTKLAKELTEGNSAYVRQNNLAGKIHALFDHNILLWPLTAKESWGMEHLRGYARQENIAGIDIGLRSVFMKAVKDDLYDASGLTPQQRYQLTLIHELRHCSDKNWDLGGLHRETEADSAAVTTLSKAFKTKTYMDGLIFIRANNLYDATHGDALFLDAMRSGKELPRTQDMADANERAADYMYLYSGLTRAAGNTFVCKKDFDAMQAEYQALKKGVTSPLAKRRIDLYEEHNKQLVRHNSNVKAFKQQNSLFVMMDGSRLKQL